MAAGTSCRVSQSVPRGSLKAAPLRCDAPRPQVWVYDAEAGTPEERARAEELRRKFAESRLTQKHSADELLR